MHRLRGLFREEAGGVAIRHGQLMLEERNGAFIDAEDGGRVTAEEFALTRTVRGIDVTGENSTYHFDPDAGECERVGLSIRRLAVEVAGHWSKT
jgi:hypothetical protein